MMKQVVIYSVAVMTALLAVVILWQFRIAVVYLLISVTLAATLRPLATRLVGQKLLLRAAWILIYVISLASIGFFFYLIGKVGMAEIQRLSEAISAQNSWKLPAWLQGSLFQQMLVTRLLTPSALIKVAISSQAQSVLPAILGITQSIASIVSGIIIIILLSLYWMINKSHFERLWLSLLPSGMRKNARDVWEIIEPDLGAYIRSQLIHSLLVFILLGLGYWVIGSPYPMLMSLVGGVACLIPFIGGVIAVILPLAVGLLAGTQLTLLMGFYTFAVLIALGVWVKPRLYHHRWDNPILTLVILIALASAFSLLGIIIAPPISAICQILWSRLVNQRIASGAVAENSDFKQRQESVWVAIRALDEPPPLLLISTMERLTQLIEKAEPILHPDQTDNSAELVPSGSHQPDQE